MYKISSLIILALLVSSCSLQKRLYNKGYYASKTHSLKKNDTDTSSLLSNIKPVKEKKIVAPLLANVNTNNSTFNTKHSIFLTDCDTIVLRSGAKILANITEISPDEIKFRNCNSPNEPFISLKRSNINYIVYTNGRKEIMEDESFKTIPYHIENRDDNNYKRDKHHKTSDSGQKINGFSIAGFWLSIFLYPFYIIGLIIYGFYLLSFSGLGTTTVGLAGIASSYLSTALFYIPFIIILAGFILSIVAIFQISQNKENRKGMGLAVAAAILCLFAFIFLFVLFI
jgi:hypothetical protein